MLYEEKRSKDNVSLEEALEGAPEGALEEATPDQTPKEHETGRSVSDKDEEKHTSEAECGNGAEKSGSEEGGLRSGSEEVEEHRAVVQLEEMISSGDDKDRSTSPATPSNTKIKWVWPSLIQIFSMVFGVLRPLLFG